MSLFRLDASIRVEGSHSREIADIVENEWRAAHPDDPIVRRHIGVDVLPPTAWADAAWARYVAPEKQSPAQRAAVALAGGLLDELVGADALLFAVPLYNYGVSQHFKTWVDTVLADTRMAAGAPPLLAGKPAVLVTVRGGGYGPGTPRAGWDHATPWMRRILADVWQLDLEVVETELTLVGVDPNLDRFKELAGEMRTRAEELARQHGRALPR
ncbi:NAD(P)H-dependent oxidoreductase [Asanoa sp. NPDC049573]|uniref:FMN-dependent NADH-azoreductase n=1 Tax=Asanoa sp. NPDC049573 TaxID=3155396 RepID=UPI00342A6D58